MAEDKYSKAPTPLTIPTPEDEQSTTPTDMISEAVEEIVDNVQDEFDGDGKKKKQ